MDLAMIENSPFRREVREWQRVDPNTGALLTGRLEADRWNNGLDKKYGIVIDSQNVSTPNGTQLSQRKELEVLQAHTTVGSLQVVRSSTIQTSSSRRSILSQSNNNDINAAISNNNGSFTNISNLMNDRKVPSSSFETNWNGEKYPVGYVRGKSASAEDVTFGQHSTNSSDSDDDEPLEWRRVSKIRRSLQYPKSIPKFNTRPTDLPENLVNISKIKRDFENGFGKSFLNAELSTELMTPGSDYNNFNPCKSDTSTKNVKKASFITADSLRYIRGKLKRLSDESLYKDDILASPVESIESSNRIVNNAINISLPNSSADTKVKYRQTNSELSDCHLRRKSYGFENMLVQGANENDKTKILTDSGLGQSGGKWSSMESNKPRGTIITLGDETNNILLNRTTNLSDQLLSPSENGNEIKRHSIAVDETKYIKDSKTLINLNGLNLRDWNSSSSNLLDENARPLKRVEFCKTEVHFAAESGRVNIVETDGKPPSTNNFRRRRRISASNISSDTKMHFIDEKLVNRNTDKVIENENRIFSIEQRSRIDDTTAANSTNNDKDDDVDEFSLRGILKNKPVKPRPYHLGENIQNSQRLWGVRLKPTGTDIMKKSNGFCNDEHDEGVFSRNEHDELKPTSSYSTKVKLNSSHTSNFLSDTKVLDRVPLTISSSSISRDYLTHSESSLLSHSEANDLKSTSLIMKTIKSANQFDEAMKNLTAYDQTSTTPDIQTYKNDVFGLGSSFRLVSSLNSSKSSSSSSILFEDCSTPIDDSIGSDTMNYEKYSSPTSTRNFKNSDEATVLRKPIAAPRIKKIGPSTGLSLQLSQLRRIYEAADQSTVENDTLSKDVIVKDSQLNIAKDQPDEFTTELSGSWSRMKARRNMIKQHRQFGHESDADELPNTNMMSIILNPSTETNNKTDNLIATPGTNTFILDTLPIATPSEYESESLPFKRETACKNLSINLRDKQILTKNESFKPINGARKLKEHELSYFGLNVKSAKTTKILIEHSAKANRHDGKLTSDKPDLLLNHSPTAERSPKYTFTMEIIKDANNPIYENFETFKKYDRKLDLERDEMILKELNEAADEIKNTTLQQNEKEKFCKRHLQAKPFDTIEKEKEKLPKKQMQSKAVQVSSGSSEILTRIEPLASSSESVSSTGYSRQTIHNSASRASSKRLIEDLSKGSRQKDHSRERGVRDSTKCARPKGHRLRDDHTRSNHDSHSCRRANCSAHEISSHEEGRTAAVIVAPTRRRRSSGVDHTERESHRKFERYNEHPSSSNRLSGNDKNRSVKKSHQSKELSPKEKVKATITESDKKLQKPSITTTTTTHSIKGRNQHHSREKSSRNKL